MKASISLSACVLYFLVSWHGGAAIVSVDDCTEAGAHRYHAHSSRSASYTSGYSQQHPSPSGTRATSSSYMRSGSAAPIGAYTADNEGDLQVASSVYSPVVTRVASNHQSSDIGGYGLSHANNEDSNGYLSRTGYGSANLGHASSTDSHVREKYEHLKGQADAFVHGNAPPPVGALATGVPIASHLGTSSSSSQYQQETSAQRYGAGTGNVLGVTYGTTGTEEDNSQNLVPVPATLPSAGALIGAHKESHNSAISYSTSGVAPHTDGVDFSISHNTPLGAATHSSSQHLATNFEELKQKAEAFVHKGGPPPSSSSHVSADGLTQSSTHVETLPPKATSHNTYVVPVRVTVTRERTVLPSGGEGYYDQTGDVTSSSSQKSYTSTSQSQSGVSGNVGINTDYQASNRGASTAGTTSYQSGNTVGYQASGTNTAGTTSYQSGNTVGYPQPGLGSASSYSYNGQVVKVPPKVYTVGPQGTFRFPQDEHVVETSTASAYGSSAAYTKQSSVRTQNVIVPGAVVIANEEEARKRSDKLFDLVSGYGTFLPAKEEEVVASTPEGQTAGGVGGSYVKISQSGVSGSNGGYQSGSTGGYQSGSNGGYQSGSTGGYQSGNTGGYQSGVAETSEEYHTRVSGSGGYQSRTSGVSYQPTGSGVSYQPTGSYQGIIPAGGGIRKTTTVYSSYSSNQGLPSISPGVPIGDPLSPPEVSGSYFSGGGGGSRHSYSSNYASRSGYGTSGDYGVRNENLGTGSYGTSGGYGVRNDNTGSASYGTSGGYGVRNDNVGSASYGTSSGGFGSRNEGTRGYGSRYESSYSSRDATSGGYGVKGAGSYGSRDATLSALPLCDTPLCDVPNIIPGSTGGVKKYGISSSWSSKSQTVNGKTHESKEAVVTVNDNGKVDTYATHS